MEITQRLSASVQVCSSLLQEAITVSQPGGGLARLLLHPLLAGLKAQQQLP